MLSVSTYGVLLLFFVPQALGQSISSVAPNGTNGTNVTTSPSPTVVSSGIGSATLTLPSTNLPITSSKTLPVTSSTTLPVTSSTTTPTELTTKMSERPTTTPSKKTCAKLGVVIDKPWNDTLSDAFSSALSNLYRDSDDYKDAEVSVNITNKEGQLFAEARLSLVFQGGDEVFIEDLFKNKVATGELDADLPVKKGSAEFEPLGVSWTVWKAKDGECEEKCEGAGGPFFIVRECEDVRCSCKGHKTAKKTKECTTYCSSTVAVTVSSVMLVIGIFLSSSFQ